MHHRNALQAIARRPIFWIALCVTTLAPGARAETGAIAGSFEAVVDGNKVALSSLRSRYAIDIDGDIANVKLTQEFNNPYDQPLNATYLFPLNRQAAVHTMIMHVGDEVIRAEIQEIRKAKQTFSKAKKAGKAAALLEQHRPNMFTQRVANLMPGVPIQVEIHYTQLVPQRDGAYELVVPMVVGPRYQPAGAGVAPDVPAASGANPTFGQWELEALPPYPATAGVDLPSSAVAERVSMTLTLETPVPLQQVHSSSHPLTTKAISPTRRTLNFAKGRVLDNRDFILRYTTAAAEPSAGLLTHWQADEGGYFSLLIEPPAKVSDNTALPREMVFLLDCSGSMGGTPMNASKAFMAHALQGLRASDTFRIIRFSDVATEFSASPLPATAENIQRGLNYTNSLYGSGGTVMSSGIKQALGAPAQPGVVRNVIFLTDGYVGNEIEVLKLVNGLIGDIRLYAFGVGAGVNRYLLSELGRTGRGFTRYFDPTASDESVDAVVRELANKLQSPVLTDLQLDWGDLPVTNVVPAQLPDLYHGNSIRVTGRFSKPAHGHATVTGRSRGRQAAMTTAIALTDTSPRPGIRRVWARSTIAEHMHAFITPPALRPDRTGDDILKAIVTDLGLTYGLATRWTAFVAVSRKVYNGDPEANQNAQVALPKVAGVSQLAYGKPAMTGHGAPEPGMWLGFITALATLSWWRRRQLSPRSRGSFPLP